MRVAIIGAGLGGITTAVKLDRAGVHDFVVFEKSAGPGGTWWDNRYPGAQVDIVSHVYSFSFMPYPWSGTHAYQPEILQYIEDTIDHFGIRDRFRFSTAVRQIVWEESRQQYRLVLDNGEQQQFDVVVSCVGMLNVPNHPDWPGLDSFTGPKFHTARWEHEHDFRGKRLAIVGTGSSAAQVVPAIAEEAGRVLVFQREPGWVLPKGSRAFSPVEFERFRRSPLRQKLSRWWLAAQRHGIYKAFRVGTRKNSQLHEVSLSHLEETVRDPAVRSALTPSYPFGCKRMIMDDNYLSAFNLEHVTLVPKAVTRVTPSCVVDSDGIEHCVDAIVMATGFQAHNYLATLDVVGRGGRRLHDVWDGDPSAVLGMMVPGFPNFFILYGPNTNGGGTILVNLEMQADVVVRLVRRMIRRHIGAVDTRPRALERWTRWIDRRNAKMQSVTAAGCNNYYFSPRGRNVTQYPGSHLEHRLLAHVLPWFTTKNTPHTADGTEAASTATAQRSSAQRDVASPKC